MISLDNTYNSSDLRDFDDRVEKNINSIENHYIRYEKKGQVQ